ncbi:MULTISPECIES: hypothetical protein [unclassified Paenibacillus]|uniref:hypothetical protein n=1 Tax=unclassified Paenibacillus TaxID=185978 RepID=UPI00240587F3|nr:MULTISPECIES: hypothetical protein [unclassified Paenibacillus]MDF9852111.1 hypothetical protein [Paenibacillus sp. PastM-2]MDH6483948.1 hypothetical protein [Paenibacillus sp. PastH-2]
MIYSDPTGHRIYEDNYWSKADQKLIDQYTAEFNKAKAAGNTAAMQAAHDKAIAIRVANGAEVIARTDYSTGKTTSIRTQNGGVHEDYLSEALAVPALAAALFYGPTIAPTVLAVSDVATMGTTISTGTVIAAQAVNTGSKMVTLFRSMSDAELAGIAKKKAFDAGFNMEGKWFATTLQDAMEWANMPGNSRIVSVTVNKNMLNGAYYSSNLDNIGPAYYFELEALNAGFGKVTVVK